MRRRGSEDQAGGPATDPPTEDRADDAAAIPPTDQPADQPTRDRASRSRWLTGDRVGVLLLWLLIVASLVVISLVAWNALRPAS